MPYTLAHSLHSLLSSYAHFLPVEGKKPQARLTPTAVKQLAIVLKEYGLTIKKI